MLVAVAVLAAALVLLGTAFVLVVRWLFGRIDAAEKRVQAAEDRADRAPKLSRAINMGKIGEQFAPLLPSFPYDFKDVQWVGGKVDAIVWKGLEAVKSGTGSADDVEVILLEVKTGKYARLDDDQRVIRDAATAGRMRFDTFHLRPELEAAVRIGLLANATADEEETFREPDGGPGVEAERLEGLLTVEPGMPPSEPIIVPVPDD
jgi:predicted Holliday junction resolvase-like endonuclease